MFLRKKKKVMTKALKVMKMKVKKFLSSNLKSKKRNQGKREKQKLKI